MKRKTIFDILQFAECPVKIYLFLAAKARFKPNKELMVGQCVTSYRELINETKWMSGNAPKTFSNGQIYKALKKLEENLLISRTTAQTKAKTNNNILITVNELRTYKDYLNIADDSAEHIPDDNLQYDNINIEKKEYKKDDKQAAMQKAEFLFSNLEKIHQYWTKKPLPERLQKTAEIAMSGFDLSGEKLEKDISSEYVIGAFEYLYQNFTVLTPKNFMKLIKEGYGNNKSGRNSSGSSESETDETFVERQRRLMQENLKRAGYETDEL